MANNSNEVQITFKAYNQEFNKSMTEMNKETASLRQQMKLQQEQMKHNATDSEKLESKLDSLQQIYEVARRKTEATTRQLEEVRALWGENSEEAKKLETQLRRNQIAEQQAANAITATQQALQRAEQAQADQTQSLRQLENLFTVTGQSVSDFSDLLGRDLTRAIQNGSASAHQLDRAFTQIAQATQGASANVNEVRQALSQLDNGASIESVQNNLRALNNVSRTTADEVKSLQQAMRLQQEGMKHTATESQKLEAKLSSLEAIYAAMQRETQETAQQLQAAKAAYGENSREAQQLEAQLQRNRIAQQQMANTITETRQAIETQERAFNQLRSLMQVTGRSVNDFSDVIGADMVNAINQGRASAQDLDRAFEQISRATQGTSTNIDEIRRALSRLDGSNIEEIRRDLERLGEEADEAEQEVNGLTDSLKSMAGAAVAAVGIGTAVSEALDSASLDTSIKISFDVPESSKDTVRQAVKDVEAYGVDGEAALEGVRRQWALNKDATDEANQEVVNGAAVITRAYSGVDFTELIQETNEVGKALGISNIEATNLINRVLKIGFPPEQLDIISEYGVQLKRAGYNAQEIENILTRASQEKSWNIDNLLDGLKEGRIRAVEMGRGVSESMKDTIRDVVGHTQKMSDEQLSTMQAGFTKQEDALSRSLSNQEKALSKSHTQQQTALSKKLDQEYSAVSKNYETQIRGLEKKLNAEYDAVVKNYEKQQRALEKSLEVEVRAFEKASEEKIKIIDNEYKERMKLIDEEKYNQLKALDTQINALNAKTEVEDKAIKQQENAQKRSELSLRVINAKTGAERQEAMRALRDFEEKLRIEKVREERKGQIDSLKEQKDSVKEASDAKKEALKTEIDERKEKLKEQTDAEKEALKERQNAHKEAFQQQKQEELKALSESNKAQIEAAREVNKVKLDALKEEHNNRKQALSERLTNEMDAVREAHKAELDSFKAMNAEKMAIAKDPPDSAAVQALFSQLEGWGKAVAKGGEEGSKAFSEMAQWLSQIEDATLREAIGVEIFGTMWEDQGDSIVSVLKDVASGQVTVAEGQEKIQEMTDQLDSDPMTELRQAVSDVKEALHPLLDVIAKVVGGIASFAKENPVLVSTIVGIIGVIGTLGGAVVALMPIINGLMMLWPALSTAFSVASGAIVAAVGTISAPVLAIVAVVAAVVIAVIAY
ncbi:tape measure protein [Lysinibacillus parviboronicapiens]|uniref:tape measure protein n=1 Tax=Lysinibacillus parviboronicapiens TaxID=436516 RepID=UPI000D3CF7EB|nr:tape measure protein [Lysinibacillus parviboronicapiens]